MSAYLHDNPLVLAAMIGAGALLIVMVAYSLTSLLFLRALRSEAPEFWRVKLRGVSIGLARFAHLNPTTVPRIDSDPVVLAICGRFALPYSILRAATGLLFAATVVLLVASGMRHG
jgi:hypothetical protein